MTNSHTDFQDVTLTNKILQRLRDKYGADKNNSCIIIPPGDNDPGNKILRRFRDARPEKRESIFCEPLLGNGRPHPSSPYLFRKRHVVSIQQVRLVIWKCKDVVSMDWASGLNDLFVKSWIEGCDPQVMGGASHDVGGVLVFSIF